MTNLAAGDTSVGSTPRSRVPAIFLQPVRHPEWRRKTEHLITTAHAALNSPDRFHRLYIKLHPRTATILEEQLHSLETALATDEQQAQTIKPPTTEERRDQRRPDLEEDNDFDIHM